MKYRFTIFFIAAAILMVMLPSGCTKDILPNGEGNVSTITEGPSGDMVITLKSSDMITKASGVADGETFKNLTILVLSNDNKIARKINKTFSTPASSTTVTIESIVFDSYKVLAYANLSDGDAIKTTLGTLNQGDTFDTYASRSCDYETRNPGSSTTVMPLSGQGTSVFNATDVKMYADVEMRRVYAWFELVIENSTDYKLKIENISLGNFNPNKTYELYNNGNVPTGTEYGSLSYTSSYTGTNEIPANTSVTPCSVYIQESAAPADNYSLSMTATLDDDSIAKTVKDTTITIVKSLAKSASAPQAGSIYAIYNGENQKYLNGSSATSVNAITSSDPKSNDALLWEISSGYKFKNKKYSSYLGYTGGGRSDDYDHTPILSTSGNSFEINSNSSYYQIHFDPGFGYKDRWLRSDGSGNLSFEKAWSTDKKNTRWSFYKYTETENQTITERKVYLTQNVSGKFQTAKTSYVTSLPRNTHLKVTVTFEYSAAEMKIVPTWVVQWVDGGTSTLPFGWE